MIHYCLWVVALIFFPGALLYGPLCMLLTELMCRWLNWEIEESLAVSSSVDTNPPEPSVVSESLTQSRRTCVGWSPLCPFIPILIAFSAIGIRLKRVE